MASISKKRVLLGVSGGVAAYKSALVTRLLKQAGHEVRVVMTEGAQAFITPMTLQALSGEDVRTALLDPQAEAGMGHIELARWADLILIVPATADLMARLAHGIADDLLTTLCLASEATALMAPAMNQAMWRHPATQRNLDSLVRDGWHMIGPAAGEQACGDTGYGRMSEPDQILAAVNGILADQAASVTESPMPEPGKAGPRIVITLGPTREPLDPVRYLSNQSSGRMGIALARQAILAGAEVTLICGPIALATPPECKRIDVTTALDMQAAAQALAPDADIFIGCAAVADYRSQSPAPHKLKKTADTESMTLTLVKNPDIIADIAHLPGKQRPEVVVGFAAETRHLEQHALEKLTRKRLDMIVANDVSLQGLGFGSRDNSAWLIWKTEADTGREFKEAQPKDQLAQAIISHAMRLAKAATTIQQDLV